MFVIKFLCFIVVFVWKIIIFCSVFSLLIILFFLYVFGYFLEVSIILIIVFFDYCNVSLFLFNIVLYMLIKLFFKWGNIIFVLGLLKCVLNLIIFGLLFVKIRFVYKIFVNEWFFVIIVLVVGCNMVWIVFWIVDFGICGIGEYVFILFVFGFLLLLKVFLWFWVIIIGCIVVLFMNVINENFCLFKNFLIMIFLFVVLNFIFCSIFFIVCNVFLSVIVIVIFLFVVRLLVLIMIGVLIFWMYCIVFL